MSRVTISDLADKLGISAAAVSYALNGRPGVSSTTRQRVLDLADEMGWRPHSIAPVAASEPRDVDRYGPGS
jgi:DNA-binding LacI/PurR family transcriptional regulator